MNSESESKPPSFPCPGCGFVVFREPSGSYDICPLCNWEDDHVQLQNPGMQSGANGNSLFEWQVRTLKGMPLSLAETRGYNRDASWRPLRPEECTPRPDSPRSGMDYFLAASQDAPVYYWKSKQS